MSWTSSIKPDVFTGSDGFLEVVNRSLGDWMGPTLMPTAGGIAENTDQCRPPPYRGCLWWTSQTGSGRCHKPTFNLYPAAGWADSVEVGSGVRPGRMMLDTLESSFLDSEAWCGVYIIVSYIIAMIFMVW